jgi:hypothetical protein
LAVSLFALAVFLHRFTWKPEQSSTSVKAAHGFEEWLQFQQRYLNTPALTGTGTSKGGPLDVDFNDDALYAPYT